MAIQNLELNAQIEKKNEIHIRIQKISKSKEYGSHLKKKIQITIIDSKIKLKTN